MEIKYSINEISSVNDRLIEEFSCGNVVIDNCLKKGKGFCWNNISSN